MNSRDAFKLGAIPVMADAKLALRALIKAARENGISANTDWADKANYERLAWEKVKNEKVFVQGDRKKMSQGQLIGIINSEMKKGDTLVAAAGIWVKGTPIGDLFSWTPEETARKVFAQKRFIKQMLTLQPSEEELEVALKNRQMAARLCWSPRLHNPDLRKWLHRLKIPTLIIWGDCDGIFPEPYAHAYQDLIPNSTLKIYKNCGHVPMLEARDDFLKQLLAFTQEVK